MKHDGPLGVAGNQGTVHSGSSLPNALVHTPYWPAWSNGRAWARSRIASNITGAIVMVLRQGWARSFPIAMCDGQRIADCRMAPVGRWVGEFASSPRARA
jgi:hypothetical protein